MNSKLVLFYCFLLFLLQVSSHGIDEKPKTTQCDVDATVCDAWNTTTDSVEEVKSDKGYCNVDVEQHEQMKEIRMKEGSKGTIEKSCKRKEAFLVLTPIQNNSQ